MNDEIKEILFLLHNDRLTESGKRKLEDYITNLQEENKNRISESLAYDLENARIKELQEERKTLYKYTPEKGFKLVGDEDE